MAPRSSGLRGGRQARSAAMGQHRSPCPLPRAISAALCTSWPIGRREPTALGRPGRERRACLGQSQRTTLETQRARRLLASRLGATLDRRRQPIAREAVGPWRRGATRLHNGRLAAVERTRVWCWPCWHGTAELWDSIGRATAEGKDASDSSADGAPSGRANNAGGDLWGSRNSRRITCRAIAAGVRARYSGLRATARGRGAASSSSNGSAQHACIYPSSRTGDDGSGLSRSQTSASGVAADGCGRRVPCPVHTDRRVSFLRRPRPPHRRVLHALPTPPGCPSRLLPANIHSARVSSEHSRYGDSRALHRQACLPSFRRRSLIPARSHPRTAPKRAPRPAVQGGGWPREALVV
jgi:hypothetical protein